MDFTNTTAFPAKALTGSMGDTEMLQIVACKGTDAQEEAEEKPLANLERPDALVRAWHEQPCPACFFKPKGSLELHNASLQDPEKLACCLMESGFNQAVPGLVVRPEDLGSSLRLVGF